MSRLTQNALANAVFGLLPLIVSFLLTPTTIRTLGVQSYGLLQLMLSVLGYLTLVDMNISVALIKYVAECRAQNDTATLVRLTRTAISMYLLLGLVMVGASWVLTPIVVGWLQVPTEWTAQAAIGFRLLAAVGFLSLLQGGLSSALNGSGAYGLTAAVNSALTISTASSTCVIGWLGGDIVTVLATHLAINGMFLLLNVLLMIRRYSLVAVIPWFFQQQAIRLLRFSALSVAGRAAAVVDNSVDRIAVGAVLGVGKVAHYSVPLTLARVIGAVNTRLASVVLPAASGLHSMGDLESLHRLYFRATRVIAVLNAFVVGIVVSVGPVFLFVWLGPEFQVHSTGVLRWLAFGYFMSALTAVPTFFVDALGRPYLSAGTYLAQVLLYSVLVIHMTVRNGLVGTAMAFAVGCVLVSPLFVWYAEMRVLKLRRFSTSAFYLRVLLSASAGAATNVLVAAKLTVHGWGGLMLLTVVAMCIQGASLLIFQLVTVHDLDGLTRNFRALRWSKRTANDYSQ